MLRLIAPVSMTLLFSLLHVAFCSSVLAQINSPAAVAPARLNQVLTSNASVYDKAKACERLAVVGDVSSVDALVPLIEHPQLSDYALTALLRIPGAEVDAALIAAVSRLGGTQFSGLMGVVGQRRIEAAVKEIDAVLKRSSPLEQAELQAAYRALGNIGSEDAARVLGQQSLGKNSTVTSQALRDALLRVAQRRAGTKTARSEEPDGKKTTVSGLTLAGNDFNDALQAARRIGSGAGQSVAAQLPSITSTQNQALVLICLGDMGNQEAGNTEVLGVVRSYLDSGDPEVVLRATETVARLGGFDDATKIPIELLQRGNAKVVSGAMAALASVGNESIDAQVTKRLSDWAGGTGVGDELDVRLAFCRYAAIRRLETTTQDLLEIAKKNDGVLGEAALQAAGLTVGINEFGDLIDHLIAASVERDVATATLQRACVHLPQDGAARIIQQKSRTVSDTASEMLLGQLAFLGGPKALAVVIDAATSGDDAAVDAATRVLGEWTTPDVAAPLLKLATELPENGKYRTRVLRGYLRVGRQLDMPTEARVELCKNALSLARRDDERGLVLDILSRNPSRPAMVFLVDRLDDDSLSSTQLRNRGYVTLVRIAERVAMRDPSAVAQELGKLDLSTAPASAQTALGNLASGGK